MINSETIRRNLINLPQIVFEVTDVCNLQCKYCGYAEFYGGYDKRENQYLSFKKAKQILDYLFTIWQQNCNEEATRPVSVGFYGGEPLLNMNLVTEIVEYVSSKENIGKKFIFNMTTNAVLLDKYADYLAEHKFTLLISLDGDREGHAYRVDHTGKNSFDKVIKNIKLLQAKHPDYFKRFVMFNSVLHNKNSVESIFHFIKNNFNKEATITQLNTSGIRPEKKEEFWETFKGYMESVMSSRDCEALQEELFIKNPMTEAVLDYLHYKSGNIFESYNQLLFYSQKDTNQPQSFTGTCTPFSKKLFVTVNGKILQCEKIDHKFYAGVISDTGIDLDLDRLANSHNRIVNSYKTQCETCGYKTGCKKCVYQDEILSSKPICLSFRTKESLETSDKEILRYLRAHPALYYKLLKNTVVR